jgi:hypothetical protein
LIQITPGAELILAAPTTLTTLLSLTHIGSRQEARQEKRREEDQTEKQIIEPSKNNSLEDDLYGCIQRLL